MKIASPWMLLAALPATAVLLTGWVVALRRGRPGRLGLVLRTIATVLLALGAAGAMVRWGGRPAALVMLDRSASMSSGLEEARNTALAAGRALAERFDVSYASFGASARTETAASIQEVAADGTGTDLGQALALARKELGAGEPLVLISDGRFGVAALHASTMAWGTNAPRLVVLPAGPRSPDAAITGIDAPAGVRPGERLAIIVHVTGTASAPTGVRLTRRTAGGEEREVGARPARLPSRGRGSAELRFDDLAPEGGVVEYVARIAPPGDAEAGNNAVRAFVPVLGPIRAGVIARTSSPCAARLAPAGIRVTRFTPDSLPEKLDAFDVLLLENLPRAALGAGRDRRIAAFVRAGGGLVMAGGPDSYASGGFHDGGEIEKVLPASMIPPDDKGLFAVLVLDRSGSMGHATNEGDTKLEKVRRAAGAIMDREAFSERDFLAVVVFSSEAELLGAPISPVDERAAAELRRRLSNVSHGGSTDLVAAIEKAVAVVAAKAPKQAARHIILLSDGLPVGAGSGRGRQRARLLSLAKRFAAAGGTLSTVGTGSGEEDLPLLTEIARAGHGRFHRPANLGELAAIFRRDLSSKRAEVIKRSFEPVPTARGLAGLPGKLPKLEARNRISKKKLAWTALEAPAPTGTGREPLLVAWELGRGRAACFASGLGNPWNREALATEDSGTLCLALVRWAAGRSGRSGCQLELLRDAAGRVRLQLVARKDDGSPLSGLAPSATVRGLESPVALKQESPSRYAADIELPPGATELVAAAGDPSAGELARAVIPVAYPREILRVGVDREALGELARLAGGRLAPSPARLAALEFETATGRGNYPAAPALAAAALVVILFELALRATRR